MKSRVRTRSKVFLTQDSKFLTTMLAVQCSLFWSLFIFKNKYNWMFLCFLPTSTGPLSISAGGQAPLSCKTLFQQIVVQLIIQPDSSYWGVGDFLYPHVSSHSRIAGPTDSSQLLHSEIRSWSNEVLSTRKEKCWVLHCWSRELNFFEAGFYIVSWNIPVLWLIDANHYSSVYKILFSSSLMPNSVNRKLGEEFLNTILRGWKEQVIGTVNGNGISLLDPVTTYLIWWVL